MNNKALFSFFLEKDNQIVLDAYKMEIYIPSEYFESSDDKEIAYIYGAKMQTLGIFYFKIFTNEKSTGKLHLLNMPVDLDINVYDFTEKSLKLEGDDEEKYHVFTYSKDDIILDNLNIIASASSVVKLIKMVNLGKLPSSVAYEEIPGLYHNAMAISRSNLNAQSVLLEITIAELCRLKKNPLTTFRMFAGKNNYTKDDFKIVNIRDIPKLSSTFTALIFERVHDAIVASVNMNRENVKEKVSPLEKNIKY
jgi:hypothetical protein